MPKRIRRNPANLLSVTQVSEKFDFHPNTVRAWISRDGLRCYRKGPLGKIFLREDDVVDFIANHYEIEG